MSTERYPSDLIITAQDFTDCGWKDALAGTKRGDYTSMWQAFSDAALQAMKESRESHGKALWLLADACSMMLNPKSINEPYKPFFIMEGRRGPILEDFSDTDITFFSQILDTNIDNLLLRARLADLLWLKLKPRDPKYAYIAIDSYRSLQLDKETWFSYGRECWERAIVLAHMFKNGSEKHLEKIETAIISAFELTTNLDGYFSLNLAYLLYEKKLAQDKKADIALKLESLANEFKNEKKLDQANDFFEASANWYKRDNNDVKFAEMTVAAAESLVGQAEARITAETPSHMAATGFFERAIQNYRTIPHSERSAYNVDERISELLLCLKESGEKALNEMGTISTEPIDISHMIENARESVHGKNIMDAMLAFVNNFPDIRVKELRGNTVRKMLDFPLQSILSRTLVSQDGRVINKRPGISGSEPPTAEDEIIIESEMIRDSRIRFGMCTQGHILPALEYLILEHRLRESDFILLARNSPIVPIGHECLFGKALFAGYDYDFVTALHILVPQIENMVRFHLKSSGVKTTTLNGEGIETENGLSTLIDLPECKQIFGDDITFEIKALFCDTSGPNLRNELAHGLLNYEDCQTVYVIYAWWFGLKLVLNTFWNSAHKSTEKVEEENIT
ncbi:MAG: DUF4209 domain-containing protein [Methanomicrobiaceae archaeon]|nr:DUF4209 domain-containing protein [Methanomicrobiaceae archaeon]